jgi:eukaryotic-like serine/threonine-protein kinase
VCVEAEEESLVGKKIGRYELRQVIGTGGMATVFRAFDQRLEREVALKLFRRESFSPSVARRMLRRFDREAKALARLSHPNIVEILDYGSFEDSLFLVMKYIPGGTLKEKAEKPFAYPQAARLLAPIARALDYAHREGIIHRDVKPANILLTRDGDLMLSDFGIAKIMDEKLSVSLTATNVGVGTPEYMAPEQWVNKVSPRSDIYALGIIFYELVTGAKPYAADTPAGVAIKQATEPIPDPRRFILELPDPVVHVILKALARRPEDRYESMAAFATALDKLTVNDVRLMEPTGEGSTNAIDLPRTQTFAAVEAAGSSKKFFPKGTGWLGWQLVNVGLSLLLGLLVVGAALISIQGVITGPMHFFLPDLTTNTLLPFGYNPTASGAKPIVQPLKQLSTATHFIITLPASLPATVTRQPLVTATPRPPATQPDSTMTATFPYDSLTPVATLNK